MDQPAPFSPLSRLSDFGEKLLGFFYPGICQICNIERATAREGFVCTKCFHGPEGVQFIEPPFCRVCGSPFEGAITTAFECSNCRDLALHFRSARSAVRFTGVVRQALLQYKYNHASWFESFLVDLLLRQSIEVIQRAKYDFIVPVPLHWSKRHYRSFNQSEILGRALAKAVGLPLETKLLCRDAATESQTRLDKHERMANVRNAFSFVGKKPLRGQKVLLFDDVLTTGATASACANVLKKKGAGLVDVWTIARGVLQ